MFAECLIQLSVYPYVRKYLTFHHSENFFVSSERGAIPSIIINLLQPMPKIDAANFVRPVRIDYGCTFGFRVSANTVKRLGNYVNGENVKRFNQAIFDLIHEEMYRNVNQLSKRGYQVDESIRIFLDHYQFSEDELPFENVKKWYYRERRRVTMRVVDGQAELPALKPSTLTLTYFAEQTPEPERPNAA